MKILIFGGNGLVGSSLNRLLPIKLKDSEIFVSTRKDTNLFSLSETKAILDKVRPDVVINAAAKVGGILANDTLRSEFILDNLKINMNILESLIQRPNIYFINLGSSCIYPLNAKNPISEDSLMTGKLEPTNSPYAMAKLTAIEIGDSLSKQFGHKIINLMPTNLYGPHDNFDQTNSHVIPGLISRMYSAKKEDADSFSVWGTGAPLREFLYVNDLSDAIAFIIQHRPDINLLNVGSGKEISIKDLVVLIKDIVQFKGKIEFDHTIPDGNPRKLMDNSRLQNLGWKAKTNLEEGLQKTYDWYIKNI
jgi:GDP-L-fucose synthase